MWILLLLLINLVLSSINPDYADAIDIKRSIPILKAINNVRSDADLWEIGYDYPFLENMQLYQRTYGEGWFSKPNNFDWKLPYNLSGSNEPNFRTDNGVFLLSFASFEYFERAGYRFLFSYHKSKKLKDLLRFGKSCYSEWKCSTTTFNNFVSCMTDKPRCKNTNVFYPVLMEMSIRQVSCIHDSSFVYCYARYLASSSDSPFYQ